MSKKVFIISLIVLLLVAIIGYSAYFVIKNKEKSTPTKTLNEIATCIQNKDYSAMYKLITESSQDNISEDQFIDRHKNIYDGISMKDYKIDVISETEQEDGSYIVDYNVFMDTVSVGEIKFATTSKFIKNKETKKYEIEWSSKFIFPDLEDTDKVRVKTVESKRGQILDRNRRMLAGFGEVSSIGLVPGKMNDETYEDDIVKIAELLDISSESIEKTLSASWVKDDTFVPLKKVSVDNQDLKQQLLEIKGIKITKVTERVYPYAEAIAHLIGYVQSVTAEDLEKNPDKGYTSISIIGKAGLEKQYEDKLRGKDGKEIYIESSSGNRKSTIGKIDVQNGEDVRLTIDIDIQKQLYNELKEDKGFFVVMQPKTGELLALVSTPSYDNNQFIYGMGTEKWKLLSEDPKNPMLTRYTRTYCPGSTFKPITAAIGLTTGKLSEDDTFNYNGLSWQKGSGWGDYYITTLTAYDSAKNIRNALIHSDNIFFAQAALKIGTDTFTEELKKIGFGEVLNLNLGLSTSQISNSGEIKKEVALADSGYGQGEILVNPVHMASIYSAFINDGNMIKPYLEYKEDKTPEILRENAFSKDAANIVKEDLIQVIENPEGTATDMRINGITLAGKTGTAELKVSKEEEANTLGWFDLITIDENTDKQYVIVSMVEDARELGGSHYLIKKLRNLF